MMTKAKAKRFKQLRKILHRAMVISGSIGLTLVFFLVLPLMKTLTQPPATDLIAQAIDTATLEAPPPPPQEEPEKEPEPEEKPPELTEEAPPLDLSQLELALNPGFSEGWLEGDFAVKLNSVTNNSKNLDELFSVTDLDQTPRAIYQASPVIEKELKKKTPATVYVVFVVDQQGRVENPVVQKSSDSLFDKAALNAVKKWKFEPGKRNGEPVRFRMRVPITFPEGS